MLFTNYFKALAILFLASLNGNLFAQTVKKLPAIETRHAVDNEPPYALVDQSTGELLVITPKYSTAGFLQLNKSLEKVRDFVLAYGNEYMNQPEFIGGIAHKGLYLGVLSVRNNKELLATKFNISTKEAKIEPLLEIKRTKKCFWRVNTVLPDSTPIINIITSSAEHAMLHFYSIGVDGKTAKNTIDTRTLGFKLYLPINLNAGNLAENVKSVNEAPFQMSEASPRLKIYSQGPYILLAANYNIAITRILRFNTANPSAAPEVFKTDLLLNTAGSSTQANSYLVDSLLFQTALTKDLLYVSVSNWLTGQKLKEFSATANEEVSFKNTAFKQKGGRTTLSSGLEQDIADTKQFLSKCQIGKSQATIMPSAYNSTNIQLRVGVHEIVVTSNYSQTGGFSPGATWDRYIYFDMLLNKKNLEQSKNPAIATSLESMKKSLEHTDNSEMYNGSFVVIQQKRYFLYYTNTQLNIVLLEDLD